MKLIAKIRHLQGGNQITTLSSKYSFHQFTELESKCEYCNTKKYRTTSFIILKDDGNLMQVGSSCVFKALGRDIRELSIPEKAVLDGFFEDAYFVSYRNNAYINAKEMIMYFIHTSLNPKEDTTNLLEWMKNFRALFTKEDEEVYYKVLEFYKGKTFENEFQHNIAVALNMMDDDYVPYKMAKFVRYAYKVYNDYIRYNNLNATDGLTSDTFTIKEIWVEERYMDYSYNYRGIQVVNYRMKDENGNLIEYETSGAKNFLLWEGEKVSCQIKKQYSSKQGKVTKVTRLKKIK